MDLGYGAEEFFPLVFFLWFFFPLSLVIFIPLHVTQRVMTALLQQWAFMYVILSRL